MQPQPSSAAARMERTTARISCIAPRWRVFMVSSRRSEAPTIFLPPRVPNLALLASRVERIEAEAWAQLQLALPPSFRSRMGIEVHRYGSAVSLLTQGADVASVN